jgi:CheY-like chemotaxis protein
LLNSERNKHESPPTKKKIKFSSIIRIREDLKNLAKKDKRQVDSRYNYSKFEREDAGYSHDENPIIMKEYKDEETEILDEHKEDVDENLIINFRPKAKRGTLTKSMEILNFGVDNRKKFKIMIVDDEPSQRQALQRQIKSINFGRDVSFEVISASDGVEALYKLMNELNENGDKNPIRCIILDENMKYLNGSKTLELINHINYLKDYIQKAYIISLSSHYSVEFEEYVKKCGCDLSVTKPIEKSYLAEILNRLLIENE